MKKEFLFIWIFFLISLIYSQQVGFGFGFTPYEVSYSTVDVKFKDNYIEKIFLYFKDKDEEVFQTQVSTSDKKTNLLISQESVTKNLTLDEIKKFFYGFGKMETIRVLLIKQKRKDVNLKSLVELRKKGKTFEEIAKRYNIDFLNDIWLESKKIYKEIFEPQEE
ncbi:MAG: hypothetical protein ACK4WJ_06000 [Endomicrobiia bacterium]